MRDCGTRSEVTTVGNILTAAVTPQPLLTFYDDATGERTELSGVTLANWTAKTGNLLVDGCALGTGDTALVLLPPHWQSAAVLLGGWSAGLRVVGDGAASVAFLTEATPVPAADRFLLGLHPLGLPLREVPAGFADYAAEVRGYGDRFTPVAGPQDAATATST